MKKQGLHYKLIKAFLLQILLISFATLLGVFTTEIIIEKVLVRQALVGEAAHFWARYREDPDFPKPETLNMKGYLAIGNIFTGIPVPLRKLDPGYYRTDFRGRKPIIYVEDRGNMRLYLVFEEQQIALLAFYFGVVPLSLALLLIYLLSWLSYRQSKQAISPVIKLARLVEKFDFRSQSLALLDLDDLRETSDSDVIKLIDAIEHFTECTEQFIKREKNFTRDASHELRTPLAVIKSSLALLQKRQDYEPNELRSLVMIENTLHDMEGLIETLLLLAREEAAPLPEEDVLINDLLVTLTEQIEHALGNAQINLVVKQNCLLSITAAEKVLNILFTNLIRNAFSYTPSGTIAITIGNKEVSVTDTGIGMNTQQMERALEPYYRANTGSDGYGLGLTIVKQICTRFGWKLKIRSKEGEGTRITVAFPKSVVLSGKTESHRDRSEQENW